jgi:hypothetical protein
MVGVRVPGVMCPLTSPSVDLPTLATICSPLPGVDGATRGTSSFAANSLTCVGPNCGPTIEVSDRPVIDRFLSGLVDIYHASTAAGENAAQYWADIAVKSDHPLAPLANIPGVFAALWTPDVAPTTAITLATAGYGFAALPKSLMHFTTAAGARGIAATGVINASRAGIHGIFGPGVYMARLGRPINGFIQEAATIPIHLPTPTGTVRIVPYLVYIRLGVNGVKVVP